MDYIIFGMGAGASLVLVGWLLRELGPRIRDRAPAEGTVLSGGELVTRMAWARFCGTCGMAMLLCGLLVLIVAGILTLVSTGDDRGAAIILGVFALTVVLMLTWTALFLRQFGTQGIIRPKQPAVAGPVPATNDHDAGNAPVMDGDAEQAPPDVPFQQAATARGGFGRFAGFIRHDREPSAPALNDEHDLAGYSDDDWTDDGENWIEEATGDEKALAAAPLVTEPATEDTTPDVAAAGSEGTEPTGSEAEQTGDAIATLRQRRLERLSQDPRDSSES